MKHFFIILVVLFAGGVPGLAQKLPQGPYAEKLVAALVDSNGTVVLLTMQEKAINGLGDAAAIGLVRHLAGNTPRTAQEIHRILFVLKMAFAVLDIIDWDADREPKATMLLLSYLRLRPQSAKAKGEIESTRSYIGQQLKTYEIKHGAEKTKHPS